MRIHIPESQAKGNDVGAFLLHHFPEDRNRLVDFVQLGFAALRRAEMVKLAQKCKLDLDPTIKKPNMIPSFDSWWFNGDFEPIKASAASQGVDREALKAEIMAEIMASIPAEAREKMAAPVNRAEVPQPALEPSPAPVVEPVEPQKSIEDQVADLPWKRLREFAKTLDINTFQKSRDDILAEIMEKRPG